jgi:uncharacterized YigZ family protein
MNSYRTISRDAEQEFIEKRSRFIGAARPVGTESEAQKFIAERRKEYWNATHNVYAYVLREGQVQRYSDDGEPQGTAGIPVLDMLLKENLTDCVVVVTRYFGGVLLGTGGLVRAYTQSAKLAIEAARPINMIMCARAVISCDYSQYGRVSALIPGCGGVIKDTIYTDFVDVEFVIPTEMVGSIQNELTELSSGSLEIKIICEEFAPF